VRPRPEGHEHRARHRRRDAGAPPTYSARRHLLFESVEAFRASFGPHTSEIFGDIPNYTEVQPVTQISEVKL
jgi:uncharacterized protein (TIGR02118 family)